jgi:hypothetical protein
MDIFEAAEAAEYVSNVAPKGRISGAKRPATPSPSRFSPPPRLTTPWIRLKNSVVYYAALRKAGVSAGLHLYAKGGHAFGLRPTASPITAWPKLVEKWLKTIGVIEQ